MVSNKTLFIYLCGIMFFIVGFWLWQRLGKAGYGNTYMPIILNKRLYRLFRVFGAVSVILNFIYIFQHSLDGPFGNNVYGNLRYYAVYGKGMRGSIPIYGTFILSVLVKIDLYNAIVIRKKLKKVIIKYGAVMLLDTFINMSRTTLLNYILFFFYMLIVKKRLYKKRNDIRKKDILIIFMVLLGCAYIFYLIAEKTNKLGADTIFDKNFFLFSYLGKPIEDFDKIIVNYPNRGNGLYTFGILGRIANKAGYKMVRYSDCFFEPGGLVYGFASGPYFDFGLMGVIVCMLINGFFVSFAYYMNQKYNQIWTIFYTSCLYSLVLSFFDYQYFMSDQLYMLIVLLLIKKRKAWVEKLAVISPYVYYIKSKEDRIIGRVKNNV